MLYLVQKYSLELSPRKQTQSENLPSKNLIRESFQTQTTKLHSITNIPGTGAWVSV